VRRRKRGKCVLCADASNACPCPPPRVRFQETMRELRQQLLDRFHMSVEETNMRSVDELVAVYGDLAASEGKNKNLKSKLSSLMKVQHTSSTAHPTHCTNTVC
jgi:hypothetical protein